MSVELESVGDVIYNHNDDDVSEGKNTQKSQEANKLPQYLAAGLATLSAFAAGTFLSWTSPALPLLHRPASIPRISDNQGSWITALLHLGALIGCLPAGHVADKIGRKTTLQLLAVPMLLAWVLIGFSGAVWGLYCGRFIAGFAIGAISVTTPLYVSELSESRVRGVLGSFFQLQITMGILFEYAAGFVEHYVALNIISSIIPILFFILFSFMPESPVYLCSKGKINEARKSLQWFRGRNYNSENELSKIREKVLDTQKVKIKFGDLLQSKATIKALIISIGLMFFQQLCGINAVISYAENIFKSSGSSVSPEVCTLLLGVVQVLATGGSTLLIDRAGRRVLLLISDSIMCICLGALGLYFHLQATINMSEYSFVPLTCVAIFMIVFSLGYGPIPWLMLGEIFPADIKGLASSIAASINWSLAFTVTKIFPGMVNTIGQGWTFFNFSTISFIGTIFVYFVVPETKGKDLEDIQLELSGQDKVAREPNIRIDAVDC